MYWKHSVEIEFGMFHNEISNILISKQILFSCFYFLTNVDAISLFIPEYCLLNLKHSVFYLVLFFYNSFYSQNFRLLVHSKRRTIFTKLHEKNFKKCFILVLVNL